jgi:hypothetical protein
MVEGGLGARVEMNKKIKKKMCEIKKGWVWAGKGKREKLEKREMKRK